MTQHDPLVIQARLDDVEAACDYVADIAEQAGMGDEGVFRCRLSVEEICTNIVEHGYGYDNLDGSIKLTCVRDDDHLVIEISDDAPLFDPLTLPNPDPRKPLWERTQGGWGVFFVRRFMDSVSYHNTGQRNHVRMIKRITADD
jgi:anti-sigma regulatory factor (Ser/Thr protein kinase)